MERKFVEGSPIIFHKERSLNELVSCIITDSRDDDDGVLEIYTEISF